MTAITKATTNEFYFGYQKNQRGEFIAVKFDADHVDTHRKVVSKFSISEQEFKWATWGWLKLKFPPPDSNEGRSNGNGDATGSMG